MNSYLTIARPKPTGFLIVVLAVIASCTSTTIDEFRQGETGIESDESVVILGRRQASDHETRSEFVECIGERMTRGNGAVRIVPERQFIDAMFPWFEPRTAPLRTRDLEQLMAEDVVARTMGEFGIRYIVWLDGVTETTNRAGSLSCVSVRWRRLFWRTNLGRRCQFHRHDLGCWITLHRGTISADATGQSFMPAIIVPIPLIARVEANACNRLAAQLKDFVNGS